MDFTPPYVLLGEEPIKERLTQLIGETVCVAWVTNSIELRKTFNYTQISVQGTLEGSSETGRYRVVVDDNNYTYFFPENLWHLSQDKGKRAIIFIDYDYLVPGKKEILHERLTKEDPPNA